MRVCVCVFVCVCILIIIIIIDVATLLSFSQATPMGSCCQRRAAPSSAEELSPLTGTPIPSAGPRRPSTGSFSELELLDELDNPATDRATRLYITETLRRRHAFQVSRSRSRSP